MSFAHEVYRNPIYIYAPPYIEHSAGTRTLYYLCDALNRLGYLSWIVGSEEYDEGSHYTSGFLNAPMLTSAIARSHFDYGLPPIVIYPETVVGNPMNAQLVARWLLNYPGALGGPVSFAETEFCFAYSKSIARAYGREIPVVFIPPVSLSEINDYRAPDSKGGGGVVGLVYAGKYRGFVGNPRLPEWAPQGDYLEIWREGPLKQKRDEVLRLVAESKVLFAFENTTLITEAVLLGTPAVLVKSDFFFELIAKEELTDYGTAWSTDANAVARAIETLPLALPAYQESLARVDGLVKNLAESIYAFAGDTDYLELVKYRTKKTKLPFQKIRIAYTILRRDGLLALCIEALKTVNRLVNKKNV
jgi:hypothetical protein